MKSIDLFFSFCIALGLLSCGKNAAPLEVNVFHLRSIQPTSEELNMVRGDQTHVLFGKITHEERLNALGQYYTFRRPPLQEKARLVFSYLQANTQSKIHRQELSFAAKQEKIVIAIKGKNFATNGRVLAWKAELWQNKALLAKKQSYMWTKRKKKNSSPSSAFNEEASLLQDSELFNPSPLSIPDIDKPLPENSSPELPLPEIPLPDVPDFPDPEKQEKLITNNCKGFL